jgi:spermidine synthase
MCDAECGFIQGSFDPKHPHSLPDAYMRANLALGLGIAEKSPKDILLIGMGTGAMARYLQPRLPHTRFDLVEIDASVPPLARRYFGLPEHPNIQVHVADGRAFIESAPRRYDLVFQDACFGPDPPRHLTTVEYLRALAEHLRPDGVVVANLAAPILNPRLNDIIASYRAVFGQVAIHPTESPANIALVAYRGARPLPRQALLARLDALRAQGVLDFAIDATYTVPFPWTWPSGSVLHDNK